MGMTQNNVNIVECATPMPVGGLRNDQQSAGLVQLTAIAFLDADAYLHVPARRVRVSQPLASE